MVAETSPTYIQDIGTDRLDLLVEPENDTELALIRGVETAVRDKISFRLEQSDPIVPVDHDPQKNRLTGNCSVMAMHVANALNERGVYASFGRFDGSSLCIARDTSGETYFVNADYRQYTFPQTHAQIKPSIVDYRLTADPRIAHAIMVTDRHDKLARSNNEFSAFHEKHPWLHNPEIIGTISVPQYAYLALESKRELVSALKQNDGDKAMEELGYHNVLIEAGTTQETNNIIREFGRFLQRGVRREIINGYEALSFAQTFFDTLPDTPSKHMTHSELLISLADVYRSKGDTELSDGFREFARNSESKALVTSSAF